MKSSVSVSASCFCMRSRPASHCGAGRLERLEPLGFLRAPVDRGQLDQGDGFGRKPCAIRLQHRAAVHPGLAAWDAQFKKLAHGKERLRAGSKWQLVPLEPGLRDEHLALDVSLRTSRRANAIAGFQREERFLPEHRV